MRWKSPGLLGLAALLSSACGPPARPSISEWRDHWSRARGQVSELQGQRGAEARAACERLLGSLHGARRELLPAPVADLDEPVQEWVHAAERLAYECPSAQGNDRLFASYMNEVELRGTEIEAALVAETPPPGSG